MQSISIKSDEFIKYLENLKKSNLEKDKEKFKKLSQWLSSYTKYLIFEENFKPQKLINYKRGDIVKANFGFNVGNELGGVHYAVVLDNNNSHSSGTLTVVPLSSTKEKDKDTVYTANLGNILNKSLEEKRKLIRESIEKSEKIVQKEQAEVSQALKNLENIVSVIKLKKLQSSLKCAVIRNPSKYGYYLKDTGEAVIRPKDKGGLGSLPNGVYDSIYTENNRVFHEQSIGKIIINGNERWNLWNENEENISFKVSEFAACTGKNEVTTMCTHFRSITFTEIEQLNVGISQGGDLGDLCICVSKQLLNELTVDGLKAYLFEVSKKGNIELYYELKNHIINELPILTQEDLDNPENSFEEEKIKNKNLDEMILKVENEVNKNSLIIEKAYEKINKIEKEVEYEKKVNEELDRIKIGSKALVSQITTISKLRVIDPKYKQGALYGIKLDEESLKKIDEKIANLFFKKLDT
ncbi:type II toxin-antitoxin system PemK/MazF family toxin [Clostridium perfringens]|uniref:type II toxin-antitoxin system PemK/MazF family toxin n=1 Tax=Clostridium perfringens TaxID=1502 RepID=UPI0018E4576B|nr:type II toxin-antitoxin system PemK/MazF family toxin [Clostridium perfringens]MBI5996636.1 type II toxin-antitoxin system PemK/MazF family toxin [Clostridium perfringens]